MSLESRLSLVISLNRPARPDLKKDEVLSFALRTDPKDKDSTTYEITIGYFSKGTAEELLLFLRTVRKIIKGQNMTTGSAQYALLRQLLQGDALAAFDKAAKDNVTETVENYKKCVQGLIEHVFPRKALATQKRYMRRFLRKPRDMKIREFMNRLNEMNAYLKEFPPFKENQGLPDDEIMDIAEFAVPSTWQKTMIMHGFNPTAAAPSEFVEFGKRIEFSEPPTKDDQKDRAESKTGNKGGKDRAKSSARGEHNNTSTKKRKASMWCEYHQTDSHDTGDCKVMIAQAKKMRGTWEASREKTYTRTSSSNDSGKDSRTTWKPKRQESHQADLKEMMQETFKEMFAQQHKMENFNVEDFKNFSLSGDESE